MEVDIEGILSLIKPDCKDCNLNLRRRINEENKKKGKKEEKYGVCKDCKFTLGSTDRKSTKHDFSMGIGLSAAFKKCGILDYENWGKSRLYYFIYHPELNFEFPPIPEFDKYGKKTTKNTKYVIDHINGKNHDDNYFNIQACLNSEHSKIEAERRRQYKASCAISEQLIYNNPFRK